MSLQYNDTYNDQVFAYANSIYNLEGGTHLSGFRTALTRVINNFAKANNLIKEKDPAITGDDVREGLVAVVSVKVPEPRFEGQTKTKLSNSEVDGIVQKIVGEKLKFFLEAHTVGRQAHHRQDPPVGPGPRGGAQGPGDDPQGRALRRRPSRASSPTAPSAIPP